MEKVPVLEMAYLFLALWAQCVITSPCRAAFLEKGFREPQVFLNPSICTIYAGDSDLLAPTEGLPPQSVAIHFFHDTDELQSSSKYFFKNFV